jgi:hypothetical protein
MRQVSEREIDRRNQIQAHQLHKWQDPAKRARHSQTLSDSPRVREANRKKAQDPAWQARQREGALRHINSADYVNARGFLGHRHSTQARQRMSKKHRETIHTPEWNSRISSARLGRTMSAHSRKKISDQLRGRPSQRKRSVQTPRGRFERIREAAESYGVSPGAIKLWCQTRPQDFQLGSAQSLQPRAIQTPETQYRSTQEAARILGLTPQAIRARIKKGLYHYVESKK